MMTATLNLSTNTEEKLSIMNIEDAKEWLMIADDDFDSANILNNAAKKHSEIICYLCVQT